MAELRFYDNIFEETYRTVEYDSSKTLRQHIEKYSKPETYKETLVECYDAETGETFFAPIEENTEHLSVLITTCGKDLPIDYEVLPEDVINIVFLPLGGNWSWAGAAIGSIGSAITYGLAGAFLTGGFNPIGLVIGAVLGGVVGFIAGGLMGGMMKNLTADQSSSMAGQKEGQSLPDVRGCENQSLLNQNFPLLLGKHLISPFVVGDPYTTYEGENGKDAYIHIAYCAGYGPLKLTDFKFGDMIVAYNRNAKAPHDTYLNGILSGTVQDDIDSGDILSMWKNNDISIELIQQSYGGVSNRSYLYPRTVTEKNIDANVLYVADKILDTEALTVYKGLSVPNKFRTNNVYFSEECPEKVRIVLNAPSGLYASRTHTTSDDDKSSSKVEYDSIPLWYAIQWRPYSEVNVSSDPNGADYDKWRNVTVWNGLDCAGIYNKENFIKDVLAHKGNDLPTEEKDFYSKIYMSPLEAINHYMNLPSDRKALHGTHISKPAGRSPTIFNGLWADTSNKNSLFTNDYSDNVHVGYLSDASAGNSGYVVLVRNEVKHPKGKSTYTTTMYIDFSGTYDPEHPQEDLINYEMGSGFSVIPVDQTVTLYNYASITDSAIYDKNSNYKERGSSTTKATHIDYIAVYGSFYRLEFTAAPDLARGWYNRTLCNFQQFSGEDHLGEARFTAEIDVVKEIGADPLLASENKIKGIEVRCIRVSPNYINETDVENEGSDEQYTAQSYSDVIKFGLLQTESFDKQAYIDTGKVNPIYIASDDDFTKFCYIAIKAKADTSGYITQTMKKFNCVAESFAPIWDMTQNKWVPEDVGKSTRYFGYFDTDGKPVNRGNAAYETIVTKEKYEEGRRAGFDWVREDMGTDYKSKIDSIVLGFESQTSHNGRPANILTPAAAVHNTSNSASMFMLACVGPQNKSAGQSYKQIDLASTGEWYVDCLDVTDGSTYQEPTVFNGVLYAKDTIAHFKYECNAYIYQGVKLEDLLAKVAFTGRAMYTYNESGQLKVVMDKPVDYPVGVISQQTLINGGSNSYTYEELPAGLRFDFSDENDGYEQNGIYCFADGYSPKNFHGTIEPYSIDFVTNPTQIWSLGRYVLACRLQSREVLTRKVGMEGHTFGLGDVVLVQDDELLIGSGSGRIQEVIEDDTYIYGFITDTPFNTEKDVSGVTVFQPSKYGKSRVITDPIKFTSVRVNDKSYTMVKGITNVILLDAPKPKTATNDPSVSSVLKYSYKTGDIVMLGDIDKISAPYRITKIKPEKDGTFTETLVPYDESFYNYGDIMPSFQTYMTEPPVTIDPITLTDAFSIAENDRRTAQNIDSLQQWIVNGNGNYGIPDPPNTVICLASRLKITASWLAPLSEAGGMRNFVAYYVYQLSTSKDEQGNPIWSSEYTTSGNEVEFKIGYLEAEDLADYYIRVKTVNISRQSSVWTEAIPVNTAYYGTWKVSTPINADIIAHRDYLELTSVYNPLPDREFYGTLSFIFDLLYNEEPRKQIKDKRENFNYVFNRTIDGYPEREPNTRLEAEGIDIPLLSRYSFTVTAVCEETQYSRTSLPNTSVNTTFYGTWIPPQLDYRRIDCPAIESGIEVQENLPLLPDERIGNVEGYYGQPYAREYQYDQDSDRSDFRDFNDINFNKYNFVREPDETGFYDGYPENPTSYYGTELYINSLFPTPQGFLTDGAKNAFPIRPKYLGRTHVRGRYRSSVVKDRYGSWSANKSINWDTYKTWVPLYDENYCTVKSNKRMATFIGEQPENRPVYGNVLYGVLVAKAAQTDLDDVLQPFDKYDRGYSPSSELNEEMGIEEKEHHLTEDTKNWSAKNGLLTLKPSYQTVLNAQDRILEVTTQKIVDIYNWYNPVKLGDETIRKDEESYKRISPEITPVRIQDLISKTVFNQNEVISTWVTRSYMQEMPLIGQNYLMYELDSSSVLRECEGNAKNEGTLEVPLFYNPFALSQTELDVSEVPFAVDMEDYHWFTEDPDNVNKERHFWAYYDNETSNYGVHYYLQYKNKTVQENKISYIKTQAIDKFKSPLDPELLIVSVPEFAGYKDLEKDKSLNAFVEKRYISVKYELIRTEMSNPIATEYRYKIMVRNGDSGFSRIFDDTDDYNVIDFEVNANAVADLVDGSITNTKLSEDCVTADKIAAGTIAAEHIAAVDLLATGASVGMLDAEGVKVPDAGFWASKAFNYEYHALDPVFGGLDLTQPKNYITEPGEFFVGNTLDTDDEGAEFLHYLPSAHLFEFKISNFKVTAVQSLIKGSFSVKHPREADSNPFFTINPSDKENTFTSTTAQTLRIGKKASGTEALKNAKVLVNGFVTTEQQDFTLSGGLPAEIASHSSALFANGLCFRNNGSDGGWLKIAGDVESGYLELASSDDGDEPIYVRQYASTGKVAHSITLMNASGGQDFGNVTASQVSGNSTSNRLIFRHLDGQNCGGNYDLYLNYHVTGNIYFGQSNGVTSYYIRSDGAYYNGRSEYANRIWNDTADMVFHWDGKGGQPTCLWGGEDGVNMYVYNPSSFYVEHAKNADYATSAGTATTAYRVPVSAVEYQNGSVWVE